jgi:porphobilinogen synthase
VAETRVTNDMLVYPYFVVRGEKMKEPIKTMPGIHHFSVDTLVKDVEKSLKAGLNKILLFGVEEEKSEDSRLAYNDKALVPTAVRRLKAEFGDDLYVMTDVCVCSYTTHGHCGILENNRVANDPSVKIITKMALAHAKAGADMVCPSDMMDGRVASIRERLDEQELTQTGILSYAAKFASAYYGPFREAADSAPSKGDRQGYQMDYRNPKEAVKEALMDEAEGADMLMVKPALPYLDIVRDVREQSNLPLAVYCVSGEMAMVESAAREGLVERKGTILETLGSIKRAGADAILTYWAGEAADWLS